MYKTKLLIGLVVLFSLFIVNNTYCQKGKSYDSLLDLTESPIDSVRFDALKKLAWENRFSDPLQAFEFAFDALTQAEKQGKGKEQAIINNVIGVLAIKIKSFEKAKVHVLKAYQIADSLNIETEKGYALNNLGEIYHLSGKLDSAILPLSRAIEIFKSKNNLTGLAYAYNQMGMAQRSLGNYSEAYKYHSLAHEIREELHLPVYAVSALQNMGIDLLDGGNYTEARKYFDMMDVTQLKNVPDLTVPYRLNLIGKTYQGENNIQSAIKYYKEALRLADSLNFHTDKRDAARLLSDIYNTEKNFQQALKYYNIFKAEDDSVKSSDVIEEYRELEMKRLFDEKYQYLEYKMQQDIDNQNLKLYWNRVLIYTFVGFSIVLLILVIILILNFRTIARKNKLLLFQKEAIETKNSELQAQNVQILEQKEAIIHQRDELEVANATKDKFFSIIAHDLRGPVGNLTTFINLILESYQDKIQMNLMDIFGVLNASAQQTYTLLENLLTWSQSQSGTIPYNPVLNSLCSLTENSIELFKQKAEEKKIKLNNQLSTELVTYFDTHMIDTVLRNLLSNALKFTPENGEITISGAIKGDIIEVSFQDTGIGMSEKELDQLFRIDVKHKTKEGTNGEKGSGLGLILCKEFIEKHGGHITVVSEPGKGSKFKFTLPYVAEN